MPYFDTFIFYSFFHLNIELFNLIKVILCNIIIEILVLTDLSYCNYLEMYCKHKVSITHLSLDLNLATDSIMPESS